MAEQDPKKCPHGYGVHRGCTVCAVVNERRRYYDQVTKPMYARLSRKKRQLADARRLLRQTMFYVSPPEWVTKYGPNKAFEQERKDWVALIAKRMLELDDRTARRGKKRRA